MTPKAKQADILAESTDMLRELNQVLNQRLDEVPQEIQALLIQKGALTQCIIRELGMLIDQSSRQVVEHEKFLKQCKRWRDEFCIPLRSQCDDVKMEDPVDTHDLDKVIEELSAIVNKTAAH